MAAGEALASLGDQIRLPGAHHLHSHLSVWETALEVIRPGSENQKRHGKREFSLFVKEIQAKAEQCDLQIHM